MIFLPHIQGTTDRISKVLRKKHIRTTFSPPKSLKVLLEKTKDPMDSKLKNGVYSIPYSYGKLYIGETGLSIKVRLKEHYLGILQNIIKISAVVEHFIKSNHYICIENAKIIATEEHYNNRRIREVVEIEKHLNNFNRDHVLVLSDLWKPLIQKLRNNEY